MVKMGVLPVRGVMPPTCVEDLQPVESIPKKVWSKYVRPEGKNELKLARSYAVPTESEDAYQLIVKEQEKEMVTAVKPFLDKFNAARSSFSQSLYEDDEEGN